MTKQDSARLLESLIAFASNDEEPEWIEFKENNTDPEQIARDISALANSAALLERDNAYKVWGVEDSTHGLVGTSFKPLSKKVKGNQLLPIWLKTVLSQNTYYEFDTFVHEGKDFVILTVRAASSQPVTFNGAAYIREGGSTTRLDAGSAKEAELWRVLQREQFELEEVQTGCTFGEVESLLDIEAFFDLTDLRLPDSQDAIVHQLDEQDLIRVQDDGSYTITNLGALLMARKLSEFRPLRKRILRVIRLASTNNFEVLDDVEFDTGYAFALAQAEQFIMQNIPSEEVVEGAFRRVRPVFPQRAVREILVNAVMHQDLSDRTMGPLVRIYTNRIEFSNPGALLVEPERLLNALPKTRNAELARLLRQMDLCEDAGSGWDITVAACEAMHLPAPQILASGRTDTRVVLFNGPAFSRMTKEERMNALYWHACLQYENGDAMSNQSLRERFGLDDEQRSRVTISRLIRTCCDEGLIRELDPSVGTRSMRYVPGWA